jgi:hypothetical protein
MTQAIRICSNLLVFTLKMDQILIQLKIKSICKSFRETIDKILALLIPNSTSKLLEVSTILFKDNSNQ